MNNNPQGYPQLWITSVDNFHGYPQAVDNPCAPLRGGATPNYDVN